MFCSGQNLQKLSETVEAGCKFIKSLEHKTSLAFLVIIQRTVLLLLRGVGDETIVSSDIWKSIEENRTPRHLMHL
jgi:hypothetical protein